ncbi:MAG TPA: hypothetical protein VIY86_02420 [Pirellulaceae bacterium]
MNKRVQTATAGLGLAAILGLGAVGGSHVFAQDATPTPSATDPAPETTIDRAAEMEAANKAAYDQFVANLAAELGSTDSAVDIAIRNSLKQSLDDQLAAGDLAANDVTAMKEVIDAAANPLMLGVGGPGTIHIIGGPGSLEVRGGIGIPGGPGEPWHRGGGRGHHLGDDPNNESGTSDSDSDDEDATPAASVSFYL